MEFSKKLFELRKAKGLSQEELAEKLNVSRQTLSKWELGTSAPDMERLIAIADYFELSLDELVLGKEKASDSSGDTKDVVKQFNETIWNDVKKAKTMKLARRLGIGCLIFLAIDLISLIVAFCMGFFK